MIRLDDTLGKCHIFVDRKIRKQAEILKYHADIPPVTAYLPLLQLPQIDAVHHDISLVRLRLPQDQLQKRRLSGSAVTHQKDELPLFNLKAHIVEGFLSRFICLCHSVE